ncbi:cytochrome P450 [Rhizoctonia solani]|nr:cytochrome P450 [Rhizoctonia solani]
MNQTEIDPSDRHPVPLDATTPTDTQIKHTIGPTKRPFTDLHRPPGEFRNMVVSRVSRYALVALLLHYLWRRTRRPKVCHPPSPPSLPFICNLFSIPPGHEHLAFAKLGEQLKSDIVYLEMLGHKLVILNSAEAALEILEKRAASHSDRPSVPMIKDPTLMNWPENLGLLGYTDTWRHYRRMLNNWLNKRAVTQFDGLQQRQARSLLQRLLSATDCVQPFEDVKNEIFFAMGSLTFQLAYGYQPKDPQDQFLKEAQLSIHNVSSAGMQTNFLVNVFPALRHIPDWFPGTGWKRIATKYRVQQEKAKSEPYEWVQSQIANGTHQPSVLASLLQGHNLLSGLSLEERDKRLKEIGIALFGAGTDTSANFFVAFVAAMVTNPHAQAKAQLELDAVLGQAVVPKISDRERLPYIQNLIDEIFRLYPVAPLGNVWAMGRDPRHYQDPEVFNPDRYLDSNVPRPPVFGWGRRKCPGIHFAETSVFINVASLLATFTFSKKKDESGQEITPQIEAERNSIMCELKPFDFELKPRSEEHRRLILRVAVDGEQS